MVVDSGGSVGATLDVVVGVSVAVEMGVIGMRVGWIKVVVYKEIHGGGCGEAGESVDVGVSDGSNGWTAIATPAVGVSGMVG